MLFFKNLLIFMYFNLYIVLNLRSCLFSETVKWNFDSVLNVCLFLSNEVY